MADWHGRSAAGEEEVRAREGERSSRVRSGDRRSLAFRAGRHVSVWDWARGKGFFFKKISGLGKQCVSLTLIVAVGYVRSNGHEMKRENEAGSSDP